MGRSYVCVELQSLCLVRVGCSVKGACSGSTSVALPTLRRIATSSSVLSVS